MLSRCISQVLSEAWFARRLGVPWRCTPRHASNAQDKHALTRLLRCFTAAAAATRHAVLRPPLPQRGVLLLRHHLSTIVICQPSSQRPRSPLHLPAVQCRQPPRSRKPHLSSAMRPLTMLGWRDSRLHSLTPSGSSPSVRA